MALTYDGTDGLFTRLGALIYMMDQVRTHQGYLLGYLANVQGEYSSADAYMIEALSGRFDQRIADTGSILLDIRAAAERTLVEMCWAQASLSTTNAMAAKDVPSALRWLIRQMDLDSETILQNIITTTSSGAKAGNNGNGALVYNWEQPDSVTPTGSYLQYVRKEVLEARCVSDAQSGTISAGSERFIVSGGVAYDPLDYRFPAGSGMRMEIVSVCASVDDGVRGQNILTNSDLEDWTSNIPDQFTVSTGTAGTDFLRESTTVARGTYSLKAAVTGNLFKIRQQLGASGGTIGRLIPDTQYVIGAMFRKDASATGTFRLALEDASATAITGAELTPIVALMSSSAWTINTVTFRTPKILPSAVYLSLSTTTAIATAAAYVDEVFVAELNPFGAGGLGVAVISGTTNWTLDDQVYRVFSNDGGGKLSVAFDRLFDMKSKGIQLPTATSGAQTILDSLIA